MFMLANLILLSNFKVIYKMRFHSTNERTIIGIGIINCGINWNVKLSWKISGKA